MPTRLPFFSLSLASLVLLILLIVTWSIPSFAQEHSEPMTDQLLKSIKTDPIYLTGIIQTLGDFNLANGYVGGGDSFRIGTARLGLGGRLEKNVNWRVQFRMESQPNLLDAWISWQAHELVTIRAGAQKPQISAELIHSTGTTDFIRRARLVNSQLQSRDIGISLYGERGVFGYNLAMFNGEGVRANQDNRFQYLGRGYYHRPLRGGGRVELGANVMTGSCYSLNCSPSSVPMAGLRTTVGADLRLETASWLVSAELLTTHAELSSPFSEERVTGSHLTGGVFLSENVQLLARWDWLQYRESSAETHLLAAGYNYDLSRTIRFQFNLMAQLESGQPATTGISGNLQVRF